MSQTSVNGTNVDGASWSVQTSWAEGPVSVLDDSGFVVSGCMEET